MTKKESKLFHYLELGFYLVFLPIILCIIPTDRYAERDPTFLVVLLIYLIMIHFVNRRFNIATFIINHNYLKVGLSFLSLLTITAIAIKIETLLINTNNYMNLNISHVIEVRFRSILTLLVFDLSFNIMLGLIYELFKQKSYRQEIETEKDKAEIALYKSQINPHFMFNSLNTLYGLYITKSEKTGDVFLKFTDMIKYMFSSTEKEKVKIEDEIKYIKEYIDLQKLRISEQTSVNFSCSIDDESLHIPPMLLIPFVENAFKYGVSSTHESNIDISISLKDNIFIFTTSNNIFSHNQISNGIGINNCKKRLELLYHNRFILECKKNDNLFTTFLKIEL